MLTSVTSKTQLDFAERVGTALLPVDAFVEKPVKPSEMLATIESVLAARRRGGLRGLSRPQGGPGPGPATGAAGSVKLKRAQWPGSDSAQMRPPCRSTILLRDEEPRPVPARVSRLSSRRRENLRKSRSASPGREAGPVVPDAAA